MVLETLKSRDEVCNVLSDPIPSATQIVQDAEKISHALHQDCVAIQDCSTPHQGPVAPSNLVNLVSNISQQIEDYHPGSDVGPALHSAMQGAYWSSVFISMVATIPSSTSSLATLPTPASASISSSSTPASANILSSGCPATLPTPEHQFFKLSSCFTNPSFSQHQFFKLSSYFAHPIFSFHYIWHQPTCFPPPPRTAFISSATHQPTLSTHPAAFIHSTSQQPSTPL